MELAITIVVVSVVSIAMGILWVNGIDYMDKNHPDYKGEDLFDEDKKDEKKTKQRRKTKASNR
jgi:hypothetical protein